MGADSAGFIGTSPNTVVSLKLRGGVPGGSAAELGAAPDDEAPFGFELGNRKRKGGITLLTSLFVGMVTTREESLRLRNSASSSQDEACRTPDALVGRDCSDFS